MNTSFRLHDVVTHFGQTNPAIMNPAIMNPVATEALRHLGSGHNIGALPSLLYNSSSELRHFGAAGQKGFEKLNVRSTSGKSVVQKIYLHRHIGDLVGRDPVPNGLNLLQFESECGNFGDGLVEHDDGSGSMNQYFVHYKPFSKLTAFLDEDQKKHEAWKRKRLNVFEQNEFFNKICGKMRPCSKMVMLLLQIS